LADHAGLEVGMKILTVNGQRAYDVDLGDLGAGTISFIIDRECDPDGTPVAVAVAVPKQPAQRTNPPVESDGDDESTSGVMCILILTMLLGVNGMIFLSIIVLIITGIVYISRWACMKMTRRQ
jgi:hypothetical protein